MSHFGRAGTTADDLYTLFDRYGKVVDVFIPRDRSDWPLRLLTRFIECMALTTLCLCEIVSNLTFKLSNMVSNLSLEDGMMILDEAFSRTRKIMEGHSNSVGRTTLLAFINDLLVWALLHVQWCLNQEYVRSSQFLNPTLRDKLLQVVKSCLVDQVCTKFAEKQRAENHGKLADYQLIPSRYQPSVIGEVDICDCYAKLKASSFRDKIFYFTINTTLPEDLLSKCADLNLGDPGSDQN
uniref:RRM domain-containing protein n=1 Tax=Chenopodium quinoa TaxID=63459 RepID=A0A803MMG2_CHEQI